MKTISILITVVFVLVCSTVSASDTAAEFVRSSGLSGELQRVWSEAPAVTTLEKTSIRDGVIEEPVEASEPSRERFLVPADAVADEGVEESKGDGSDDCLASNSLSVTTNEGFPARRSSPADDAAAYYDLGLSYEDGLGVAQDYERAREYYEQAAAQGHAGAQYKLGRLYQNGFGVVQDYVRAREWYEQAAAQGHAQAQNNLGGFYGTGLGVAKDYSRARAYIELAAIQGLAIAQCNLGDLYGRGAGGVKDYRRARDLYELAAAQGHAAAQYNLGLLYEEGLGIEKNYERARDYYEQAAAQGHTEARAKLNQVVTCVIM